MALSESTKLKIFSGVLPLYSGEIKARLEFPYGEGVEKKKRISLSL